MRDGVQRRTRVFRWRHATALALLALLLMPVSYRAGASGYHAHALIQLIHEASAGVPLHHHLAKHVDAEPHAAAASTSQPGQAAIQITPVSALLPLALLAIALMTLQSTIRPYSEARQTGRSPAPIPPPPQWRAASTTTP